MELGLFIYCWLLDEGAGFIVFAGFSEVRFIQFLLAFLEVRFIHSLLALKEVRFINFGCFEGTSITN